MFNSFLRRQSKGRQPEQTPLLAALNRYRSRNGDAHDEAVSDEDDDYTPVAQYDGGDEDENDFGVERRDGPLLPVFSEFLGMCFLPPVCLRKLTDGQSQIACPFTTSPMRYGYSSSSDAKQLYLGTSCGRLKFRSSSSSLSSNKSTPSISREPRYTASYRIVYSSGKKER